MIYIERDIEKVIEKVEMGLQQSKNVDAAEAVARCRERKQFMGAAVAARNAFAAAHAAYTVALKNTGAALSDYAHHDHYHDHDNDVDIVLPRHDTSGVGAATATVASTSALSAPLPSFAAMALPTETVLPPPPPLPDVSAPLQRAATMPGMPITPPRKKEKEKEAIAADAAIGKEEYDDHDVEDDDDDDNDDDEGEEQSERGNYEAVGPRAELEEMFLAPTETASDVSVFLKPPPPLPLLLRPQTKAAAAAAAAAAPMAQAKGMETWDYIHHSQVY